MKQHCIECGRPFRPSGLTDETNVCGSCLNDREEAEREQERLEDEKNQEEVVHGQ